MYYRARYYGANIGRFIQPDTIVPSLFNPQSLNRYTYVYNNPVRYTDPTGHDCGDNDYGSGRSCEGDDPTIPQLEFDCTWGSCNDQDRQMLKKIDDERNEKLIKNYDEAVKSVRRRIDQWCAETDDDCGGKRPWPWVDPFKDFDRDKLAKLIQDSRDNYRKQGLSLEIILNYGKNNPFDRSRVDHRVYPDIEGFMSKISLGAVSGLFLGRRGLESAKSPYEYSNREPLFYMEQVTRHPRDLYEATMVCMGPGCVGTPDPLGPLLR
jgi:hypothetical protein